MWIRLSAAGDAAAQVSISGSSARSAATASAPPSIDPANAPSTTTTERPARNGGRSGSGGRCMIRNEVVISSGALRVHSCQVRSTSAWRSYGHRNMPAYTSAYGYRRNSIAVTTPKFPPPPRSAQNRSAWSSAVARTSAPSGVTSSIAVTLFAARPCLRESQLRPPPSVYPTTPTSGEEPESGKRPCGVAASLTSSHSVPACTRAVCGLGVDLHAAHLLRRDQDRVLERRDRRRVVPGALRGDLQPGADRELDHGAHVVRIGGQRDERGALVDRRGSTRAGRCPTRDRPGRRCPRLRAGSWSVLNMVFSMTSMIAPFVPAAHRGTP